MGIAEQRQRDRVQFLVSLYEMTNGRQLETLSETEIADRAGISHADASEAAQFLIQRGLLSGFLGGGVYLTDRGLEAAERALSKPTISVAPGVAPSQVITIHGSGNVIQQGSGNVQNAVVSPGELDGLDNVLEELRQIIDSGDVDLDIEEELRGDLETIEAQLRKPTPSRQVLHATIASIRGVAEGAAGSAVFVGLLQLIHAVHL